MLIWPPKDPRDVLDYSIDWTLRLQTGETIVSSEWTVVDGDVTTSSPTEADGVTTVWLSAGTDNMLCELRNQIVTSLGRTYDQSVKIRVRDQ